MSRTAAVQMPAMIGPVQMPDRRPIEHTSMMMTSEPDSRFCANWRNNSASKAGVVPLVEVSRSRASRTRCTALRRRRTASFSATAPRSWLGATAILIDTTAHPSFGRIFA